MMKTLFAARLVEQESWPLSLCETSRWFLRLYFDGRMPLSSTALVRMLRHLARTGEVDEAGCRDVWGSLFMYEHACMLI